MHPGLGLFLDPRGRIDRRLFWRGWLVLTAVNVGPIWALMGSSWSANHLWLLPLGTLYPTVCLYANRLRDADLSPWLQAPVRLLWAAMLVLFWLPSEQTDGFAWAFLLVPILIVADAVLLGIASVRRGRKRPVAVEVFD